MISLYPISSCTRKLTIHSVLHFFDLAATNNGSRTSKTNRSPDKEKLQYFYFKLLLYLKLWSSRGCSRSTGSQDVHDDDEMSIQRRGGLLNHSQLTMPKNTGLSVCQRCWRQNMHYGSGEEDAKETFVRCIRCLCVFQSKNKLFSCCTMHESLLVLCVT